ncbi:MAG: radical SAM protein [Burkholderiales bacterium]|nr:radical SAM protein [Burkholderiales bacterium]
MPAFDALSFWNDPDFAGRLQWYRAVAANRLPAKYLICASIPAGVPLDAPEAALWQALEAGTQAFLALQRRIRAGEAGLAADPARPSLLDLVAELGRRMLSHCNFCRWECGVDRTRGGKLGVCKLAAETRVSTYFHHRGEELVYRGTHGSGTIFFTSCNMRCAFCQNGDISTDRENGEPVSARTLAAMAWILRVEGCHNINWVGGDPTIHLHTILEAIALLASGEPSKGDLEAALAAKADWFARFPRAPGAAFYRGRINAPMLWNSNFFMTPEAMKLLRLTMDVWLPDFKFGPGRCALELARTGWYWETVTRNLRLLRDWGEDFTIRHLVMPGHVECCTVPVLEWIAAEMPDAPVNIMDQYHPDNYCDPGNPKFQERYWPLARAPRREELLSAFAHAKRRGLRFEALSLERSKTGVML